jgi:hypothetical protein
MAASAARVSPGRDARDTAKTPAQWYCYLGGAALLLAGIAGFFVDSGFDTGNGIDGDKLLGFEVNGWHNIVHLLSGLLLLAAAPKRASAKTIAIAFGVVYGAVAIIGLIDGEDFLGLLPINPADNVLHIALAAAGIVAGLVSEGDDRAMRTTTGSGHETTGRRVESGPVGGAGAGGDVDTLTGAPRQDTTGGADR